MNTLRLCDWVSSQAVKSQPYFFRVRDHNTHRIICARNPSFLFLWLLNYKLGIHQGSRRWIKFWLSLAPRYQKIRFLVLTSKFQSLQCGNVIATAALFKERRPVTPLIFIAWVAVKKSFFLLTEHTKSFQGNNHCFFLNNFESQQQRHFFVRIMMLVLKLGTVQLIQTLRFLLLCTIFFHIVSLSS